jgi:hypothetical protein
MLRTFRCQINILEILFKLVHVKPKKQGDPQTQQSKKLICYCEVYNFSSKIAKAY